MGKKPQSFGGFLLFGVVSTVLGIQVDIPQTEYEVARGDNVTLKCTFVPGSPTYKSVTVRWKVLPTSPEEPTETVASYYSETDDFDISTKYRNRATVIKDIPKGVVNLQLMQVTLAENRIFECNAIIRGDSDGKPSDTTKLIVLVAPSTPICKTLGTAEYGQNINLTCVSEEGSPAPTYAWKIYDPMNNPKAKPAKSIEEKGVLSLFNVSMDSSGYYICTSTNKIKSASCNHTLTVPPPSMNLGPTLGIIGGLVAGVIVLGIVIYCCCCKNKEPEEYAMGTIEGTEFHDQEAGQSTEYRDDQREAYNGGERRDRRDDQHNGYAEGSERGGDHSRRDDEGYRDRRDDQDNPREQYDDRSDDRHDRLDNRGRPPLIPPNKPIKVNYDD